MTARFQSIKLVYTSGSIQLYWNDHPYHQDKLFPLLEKTIQDGEAVSLFIEKDGRIELDMYFIQPNYDKISKFISSYPKVKLYKSFYYFIEDKK